MSTALNLMIDLETAGVSHRAPILQIAAVPFLVPEHLPTIDPFYEGISLESNEEWGRVADPETLKWWDTQNAEVRDKVFSSTSDLDVVLEKFYLWCKSLPGAIAPWGNGCNFDIVLLEDAFKLCNIPVPWHYREVRDYRTLTVISDLSFPKPEGGHDALVDAKFQAWWAEKAILRIREQQYGVS